MNSFRSIGHNLFKLIKSNKLTFSFSNLIGTQFGKSTSSKSSNELYLMNKLRERIASVKDVDVIDISHGCGDMYKIVISSSDFKGKTLVQQHRQIQAALKEDVKNWHGLTIETQAV